MKAIKQIGGFVSIGLLLTIVLILILIGGLPNLGWHHYGWGPSGGAGVILVIVVLVLLLRGRL